MVHIGGFLGCMDLIMHVVDISFGMNWRVCEVCGDNWCLEVTLMWFDYFMRNSIALDSREV